MSVLKLNLLDAEGERIDESALVTFRNMITGAIKTARSTAGRQMRVAGLDAGANGLYRVEADPAGYLASGRFVSLTGAEAEADMRFAVDPAHVRAVDFPDYAALDASVRALLARSRQVSAFSGFGGEDLYDRLDDIRRACLLNITSKCRVTPLTDGTVVMDQLVELRDLRGDRFFAIVPQDLRDEVKNSAQAGLFFEVPSALHHPPPGYSSAGSYKTPDHYGNLQLTFFAGPNDWVADIDIDDANGLEHVFQVLRNELSGRPTHPYDIHEILMLYQQLDTGYRFEL